MEDDNEILDWGNEDDEHHETLRRPLSNSYQRNIGDLDAEDAISLGDEDEDNQEYRNESDTNGSSNARDIMGSQRGASISQLTSLTIGAKQDSHGEATHEKLSSPRKSSFSEGSPRRKQHSRDRASPQRSQPNPGRLTHALPPKPMVPPYLPPSQPSIVEATSMVISTRTGGREIKKNNGVSSATAIPSTADELPKNWEYREARNGGGRYYYNIETHVCTWERPVSSVASNHAESRSRRRRSSSTGRRHRTPPDSNPHQSQTTRASRNSAHMPPDREVDDNIKTALLVLPALSYEDRHYRPAGEPSSAVVEIRTMDRHSDVMNGRVSSRSQYDRMPPASPPPSRKRDRSLSPHESQASSWRRGRRHNNDESMLDEHPDSRNRSSLRRRESSLEPIRYQDLPPRPSELHEDANQKPVYLSAPRRGSTPPYPRDRDRHYEPMIRDYRAPPEEDPRSIASRRDRSLRHDDRPAPINIHPGPEVSSNRQRDRDLVPSSNFTHPSRQVSDREYDRNRREQQILERDGLPRRPADYPPPANQIPEQSKGHYDREPLRPHPSDFDRSAQDHVGQSSHRKRAPLPPQATTFLTSSVVPDYARDTPLQSSAAPVAPRSLRDFGGHDGNVPLGPRSMIHVNEELPPRNGPTGGAEYDRDRGRNTSRQPNNYPAPPLPINTSMNVDDEEGRIDRYSRSSGRTAEYMKAPPRPSSGTNNIPIGNKRSPYNPDARPPPSTLIDPVKARELLPPGKESYERPADLEIADTPQVKTTNDALIHNNNTSRPPESAERQLTLPPTATASGKSRQRKSRFDKPVPPPEPRREPSPVPDKGTIASQNEASNMQVVTPPPLTPEQSLQSLQDEVPPPPLPAYPGNAASSRSAGQRSGNRWSNDTRGNSLEQPQEYIGLPPVPDPTSLSYRLSNDKSRVRQHPGGPISGRDEGDEGEVELSFQNAHAELEREPVFQQERLERPQVQRRGASLLDRLSTGNPRTHDSAAAQQSLRDRLIPSKRDFEDMTDEGIQHDVSFDGEDGGTESKRARRKNGRARTRGGRRGGPA